MKEYLSKIFYLRYFIFYVKNISIRKNKITLVYSRGKTGTTTVYNSLLNHCSKIFQIHTLNKKIIDERLRKLKELKSPYPSSIIGSKYLSSRIGSFDSVNIITVVRDPISIEISSYFQNKVKFDFSFKSQDELINYLRNRNFEDGTWFDNEIKEVIGIDVFNKEFDKKTGYSVIENDNIRVLVLKLERINDVGESALSEFTSKKIHLVKSNVAKEKKYVDEYLATKKNFTVPKEILDYVYNSKYVRHFYTDKEIEKFKVKWSS